MSETPRATVTQQITLPTPIQQVKLDSLITRLQRNGRKCYLITDDSQLPAMFHCPDCPLALFVVYRTVPEGMIYFHADGRTLDTAAHKGLHEIIWANARAGEWPIEGPEDYYESLKARDGKEPDREEIEAMHRDYGWTD